jgi:hypothetical protein
MTVSVGPLIVFRFAAPLSITFLIVATEPEETFWQFIAEELQTERVVVSSFQSWPADEAPPELIATLARMPQDADLELEAHGPRQTPIAEVTYGELPAGYREESAALPLDPGDYHVFVFAEQGMASSAFTVAAV